jgi:hypothetical protein
MKQNNLRKMCYNPKSCEVFSWKNLIFEILVIEVKDVLPTSLFVQFLSIYSYPTHIVRTSEFWNNLELFNFVTIAQRA